MTNKSGIVLKFGFFVIAGALFSISVNAQQAGNTQKQDKIKTQSKIESTQNVHSRTLKTERGYNAASEVKQDPSSQIDRSGSPARNCTPKVARQNTYSFTRKQFEALPASRQEFVLNHSDKYTIVD